MKTTARTWVFLFISIAIVLPWASAARANLKIKSVYPTLGAFGSPLSIAINGSGFDGNTRVSMALDSGNRRSVVGGLGLNTPSSAWDVVVDNNIAYVAIGPDIRYDQEGSSGLQVVDISNPKNPLLLTTKLVNGIAYSLALSNSYIFIAAGDDGLQVFDVSNLGNPQKVGNGFATTGEARWVEIVGNRAYVTDFVEGEQGRLRVIDISNPANLTGNSKIIDLQVQAVAVNGNYAYVTGKPVQSGDGALVVVDVSNPSSMQVKATLPMPEYHVYGLTIVDNHAYIATWRAGIQVVDIGNPLSPAIVNAVNTTGRAYNITYVGQTAYVAEELSGVTVLDVTGPTDISIRGTIDTPGEARHIVITGNYAFVADGRGGLQSVDITAPMLQQVINWLPTDGISQFFDRKGNYIFLADGGNGLLVIDVSDPYNPTLAGSVFTNHRARDVDVVGNYAYVADTRGGLQVVDISEPDDPDIIGSYNPVIDPVNPDLWVRHVTVDGSIAYLSNGQDSGNDPFVHIIDVSTPSSPQLIKSLEMPSNIDGKVAINGNYAYAPLKGNGTVQVIDISNPEDAAIIEEIDTMGGKEGARWITISGSKAYLANGDFGISVLDISNPANPVILGERLLEDRAYSLVVDGSIAYVADGDAGVQVVDVSDPANMVITGNVDTTGGTNSVAVQGDIAFVGDFGNGFLVVPLPVEVKPLTVVNANKITCTLPSPSIPGHYILRVFNGNDDPFDLDGAVTFSDDVKNSKAIIVAGGNYFTNQDRKLEEEFQQVANEGYQAFLYQGFRKEDILFLGPNIDVDADANGAPDDVDELNTIPNIQAAFDFWAPSQSPHDIFVYLVGHGSVGYYKPNSQRVMADEVKAWMKGLESVVTGKVILIYEACQSGAFLLNMDESPENSPVVITSSKSTEESWFYDLGDGLISFSSGFWGSVQSRYGARLDTAFFSGKKNIRDLQTAWMDTNGDQRPNTSDDRTEILVVGRGYQPGKEIPIIGSVSGSQSLDGSFSAIIWANGITTPDGNPAEVFALVTPPCYNPVRSIPGTETDLAKIVLADGNGDGVYEGSYDEFSIPGTYTITIYANDSQGNLSEPKETFIYQSSGRDGYEFDNTYLEAEEITLNDGMAQCRNFYDANDEDWVKFYGLDGNIYLVEASRLGPDNNVVIEIYDTDGTTLLTQKNDPNTARADEALYWKCEEDGLYFARIRPAGPENTGTETDYRLEIYRPVAELFGSIAGTVKNNAGSPVEGVTVKTNVGASGISKDGTYFMVHRQGNGFVMTMKANGYQKKDIPDLSVAEAKTTFVHVSLEPVVVDTEPTIEIVSPTSNVSIFEGESVNFQSLTTNGNYPFTYAWEFSGGAANTDDENPGDVTFAAEGVYTVSVTVTDKDQDKATSASITVTVNKNTDPASVPDVSITSPATNKTIVAGQAVNFQASLKGGNAPFDYTWNFNGGAANVIGEDPGDVVFASPGTYLVRVTVMDNEDDHDSADVTVTVVADLKPVAVIQSPATDMAVDAGGTVNFQGSVTGGNLPLTYSWNFNGAATASTAEDPGNVTFAVPGSYTITFTVTDANGDVHNDTVTVTVNRTNGGGGGGGGCFLSAMLP